MQVYHNPIQYLDKPLYRRTKGIHSFDSCTEGLTLLYHRSDQLIRESYQTRL